MAQPRVPRCADASDQTESKNCVCRSAVRLLPSKAAHPGPAASTHPTPTFHGGALFTLAQTLPETRSRMNTARVLR